ncbi:hypothetical protein NDU88_006025 [Pleurodeles waltl]|uniref:Uncharacterized protein n=1 Tax=Pleurodeles waltl TaxID=8319 RepID=A0AAV7X2F7_PLEWA|nr:hypothetical protein NDU88_006025 [Pleurodeles waltl]
MIVSSREFQGTCCAQKQLLDCSSDPEMEALASAPGAAGEPSGVLEHGGRRSLPRALRKVTSALLPPPAFGRSSGGHQQQPPRSPAEVVPLGAAYGVGGTRPLFPSPSPSATSLPSWRSCPRC